MGPASLIFLTNLMLQMIKAEKEEKSKDPT